VNLIDNAVKHSPKGGTVIVGLERLPARRPAGGQFTRGTCPSGPGVRRSDGSDESDESNKSLALFVEDQARVSPRRSTSGSSSGFTGAAPSCAARRRALASVEHCETCGRGTRRACAGAECPRRRKPIHHRTAMERILIVEDERPMRTALMDCLAAEGYRVIAAVDGEEGLARALAEKPDLILLDVMMRGWMDSRSAPSCDAWGTASLC